MSRPANSRVLIEVVVGVILILFWGSCTAVAWDVYTQ